MDGVELFRFFLSLIRTNCSLRSHHAPSFSPNPPSEKRPSYPLQFGQVENSHSHLKEELTDFESYWYPLSLQAEC